MKHLIVAATDAATGELTHAARLARALVTAGDEVVFLLPRALDGVVAELGVRRGWIDDALPVFDRAVLAAIERERPDALLLADGASVAQAMVMRSLAFAPFVAELRARTRVVALDVWQLDVAGLRVDYGADTFTLPEELLALPRLVPVPFARLDAAGGYCAMGASMPAADDVRARVRGELALAERERLVLWAIAPWQNPERQLHPARGALAGRVLCEVTDALATMPEVHVVLVGPHTPAAVRELGARLHVVGVVAPARYAELFAAADLMFGVNVAATSLISAITAGLPALVGVQAGPPGTGFCVCPLGLQRFLAPVLADNPYLDALAIVELGDRDRLIAAVAQLLHDSRAIAALRARQAAYAARVRALPPAVDAYRALLAQ